MRHLNLLHLLMWTYAAHLLPQLAKAAFHPESSQALLARVPGGSGDIPTIPEGDSQLWQARAAAPHHEITSELMAVVDGIHAGSTPQQAWKNNPGARIETDAGLEDGGSREPKRARLESFVPVAHDQPWEDNHSLTSFDDPSTGPNWDVIWDELKLFDAPSQPSTGAGPLVKDRDHRALDTAAPSVQQPVQLTYVDPKDDPSSDHQFDRMLRSDRPQGLPTPLVGVESPVLAFEPTLNEQRRPEYAELAIRYVKKFQPAVKRVYDYPLGQDFWTGPAMQGVDYLEGGLIIRPIDPNESMALVIPYSAVGKTHSVESLAQVLTELNTWIIHVHAVLWRRFDGAKSVQPDRQKLMLWLFGEIFNPKQGLPVIGRVSLQGPLDRKFGVVQMWIIRYLLQRESVSTTSSAIVAIWSKNSRPDQWQEKFRSDQFFWVQAGGLLKKDLVIKPKQGTPTDNPMGNVNRKRQRKIINPKKLQIEDFQLHNKGRPSQQWDNTAILGWLKPPSNWELPKTVGALGQPIMEKYKTISLTELGGKKIVYKAFNDEGVAITHHRLEDQRDELCVRPWSAEKECLLRLYTVGDKLKKLLILIEACSSSIISRLVAIQKLPNQADSLKKLQKAHIDWLTRKLFEADALLPIFGIVDKDTVDRAGPQSPPFDEVQKFILKIFTDDSTFKFVEAALTLLGYWLKKENPDLWNKSFNTEHPDESFSEFIMTAMPRHFARWEP
ncbi:hypothetical protein MJO28_012313 [Puccinia striiformis f. sp. tritici]|uniref:SUN domain-containing protein n=4 Tax=Puccinia striiformis TaxID=27350 RepID=A0A0L0VDR8_9BASI|nr:hypothetical protein Pst134EA_022808 [Puccinia striiformis f. sp. tritici]KNE97114.1 hypothetical protein PSTG_09541 [Puccinia striiformis f. sp. tritici PST-78]POW04644.1 hypothetical protein PSTT_10251 [Puccinia striiformis]KAH9445830.1 hypothetical protein Pst134EB_023663 [Puccinia striiformis f. sp. tritici]KAH9455338.1 hypothetical protein Pst134EA_022808 [Puccinia striiformis f. sp. tritici]KAI7942286.1 hypothetical protein MJO28_012313 [Puccinia striiformis f. sp. tritici]